MGKRGPKPSGKVVVNTKIEPGTRDALHREAAKAGRTLSGEIEHRLRRSFDHDNLVENLGGPVMYAMLRAISGVMMMAGTGYVSAITDPSRRAIDWLNDPEAYDQAMKATNAVLRALRPPGPRAQPEGETIDDTGYLSDRRGEYVAALMLGEIAAASPTQPGPDEKLTDVELLARRIASGLGKSHGHLIDTGDH